MGPEPNRKHTMCKEQFQDSYYLNRLPPRLDRHIGRTVRRAFAVAAVGLTTFLGGCVQDGLMDMARFQLKPDDIIIGTPPGHGLREVLSVLR